MKTHPPERTYDLRTINLPSLSGVKLRLTVELLDSPLRRFLLTRLLREAGITWLRSQVYQHPQERPERRLHDRATGAGRFHPPFPIHGKLEVGIVSGEMAGGLTTVWDNKLPYANQMIAISDRGRTGT
jgi:hypothetical protein